MTYSRRRAEVKLVYGIVARFVAGLLAACLSASVALGSDGAVDRVFRLRQAYDVACPSGAAVQRGFAGPGNATIQAVPGILCIEPGGPGWSNFVSAAILGVDYEVKNTVLRKTMPNTGQCADVFSSSPGFPAFAHHGTPNIRLWWPVMYEPPGTTWTLSIVFGTKSRVMLPGETKAGYIHRDTWEWVVDPDLASLRQSLELFRQLPWGLCQVPLLSGDELYRELVRSLDGVALAVTDGNLTKAAAELMDFESQLINACTTVCPAHAPAGFAGIANTSEHPACCKLLADAEYVGRKLGIIVDGR